MCGIAGIIGRDSRENLISQMTEIMSHRGPDHVGYYKSDQAQLGHCRLAINDLSASANQPFVTEDERVSVVVNGEIYNFLELKTNLESKGCLFKSRSDSEIVLHAYLEYGLAFIEKLNGMFAFAIWDQSIQTVFLVRDRLGIKPLYYSIVDDRLLFASEIKSLVQDNNLDLSIDFTSLTEYFLFENYFSNRTLNQKIKLVEPGEIVTYSPGSSQVARKNFWSPQFSEKQWSEDKLYETYLRTVEASVDRHLLSDVPVATYLSAGIDSSTVTYWATSLLKQPVSTYTGSFGMTGYYDESKDSKRLANELNCPNVNVPITPQDFVDNISRVAWHLDEPRVGMGAFSQYMVAKRASEDVKVILTGHGGDEFFAGYPVFRTVFGKSNPLKLIGNASPREMVISLYFLLLPILKKELRYFLPNIYSFKSLKKLLSIDIKSQIPSIKDCFQQLEALTTDRTNDYRRLTLTYLRLYLPALFVVEDKISMAFSMESRTPLCDNEMLDLALSIPLSKKLRNLELKHIPRNAMRQNLPEFLFNLPKRGFPTPLSLWFSRELKSYIKEFILDSSSNIHFFNTKYIENLLNNLDSLQYKTPYKEIIAHQIWMIINLILYLNNQNRRYQ